MKSIYFFMIFLISVTAFAQNNGAITNENLENFEKSVSGESNQKAIMNALANHRIKDLAVDRETYIKQDELFTKKLDVKGISNQKSTGRCWLFAGLNIFRPRMIEKYDLENFEFSQSYLSFYDKLEKSNLFINQIIKWKDKDPESREVDWLLNHAVGDGGQWNMVIDLIEKYGLVPQYAMPETYTSSHTGDLSYLMRKKLYQTASRIFNAYNTGDATAEDYEEIRLNALEDIYKLLAMTFGKPPKSFIWKYKNTDGDVKIDKEFTPQEFAEQIVKVDLEKYVYILSNPLVEYYRTYRIQYDRNMFDKSNMFVLNLPISDLKNLATDQIMDDTPVWFGCDVGKEFDSDGFMIRGIKDYESLFGINFDLTRKEQVLYNESIPTHAMVFIGVDIKNDKPQKWLVENSWGKDRGRDGYWTLGNDWFDKYMYGVIIEKKHLSAKMLKALETEPIILPPWDAMWKGME
ncbi:MAG: C1 family peptidase [Candidatus Marinimicrobia bacterium]|jgi:bleomycin hydrolase|nr:C1 family peptidase [Candidatus Neomarinimicrobiota bacterium]